MVYIKDFEQFMDQSLNLLQIDPVKTRVGIKSKQKEDIIIILVTNNRKSFQFKGCPAEVIPRIKPLMNSLFLKMTNRKDNKTYVAPNTQSAQGGGGSKKKNKNKGKGKK